MKSDWSGKVQGTGGIWRKHELQQRTSEAGRLRSCDVQSFAHERSPDYIHGLTKGKSMSAMGAPSQFTRPGPACQQTTAVRVPSQPCTCSSTAVNQHSRSRRRDGARGGACCRCEGYVIAALLVLVDVVAIVSRAPAPSHAVVATQEAAKFAAHAWLLAGGQAESCRPPEPPLSHTTALARGKRRHRRLPYASRAATMTTTMSPQVST